jgi:hypothetical protein
MKILLMTNIRRKNKTEQDLLPGCGMSTRNSPQIMGSFPSLALFFFLWEGASATFLI